MGAISGTGTTYAYASGTPEFAFAL